jgi:hypothetical protein
MPPFVLNYEGGGENNILHGDLPRKLSCRKLLVRLHGRAAQLEHGIGL